MTDLHFLHEGERLLCVQRSTGAVLVQSLLRGVLEAITASVGLSILIGVGALLVGAAIPWVMLLVVSLVILVVVLLQRIRVYRNATLRITTERILLEEPLHLFHAPMHTVKWSQYQESEAGHKSFLDALFFARPLKIRYGTADARLEVHYPSLHYAEDIKHYLDKVDSLLRAGKGSEIMEFIAKPRGKRDAE